MRLIRKEYVLLVIASVIATLAVSTGCRTQRSIPKLADLAWWKKNDVRISSTPQPPASHFNPEPSAVMQASSTVDRVRQRELADSAAIVEGQLTQAQIENRQSSSPIRKPYSLESGEDQVVNQVVNNNSFEATGAGELNTKLPDWNNSSPTDASSLSHVQRGFEDSLQKSNAGLSPNTMANASTKSSSDFASSWRNDFALPAKKPLQGIDESIDKTIEAAADALSQADSNVAGSASGFEARAKNAFDDTTTSLAQSANDFRRNTIATPSNALQPQQQNLQDWQNEPTNSANQASTLLEGFQPATNQFESNPSTNPLNELQVLENRPPTRVAQAQPLSPQFGSNSGLPSNSLRSGNDRMSEPQKNSAAPASNAYPATPHGNYAPRNHFSQLDQDTPDSAFDTQASFDSSVTENSAANAAGVRLEKPQPPLPNSRSESAFVPETIRRGSGSFAPGSVNPLIPDSPQ